MKILLILPGGGDPSNEEYKPAYDFVIKKNKERKLYDDVMIIPLYGHQSYNDKTNSVTYWDCLKSTEIVREKFIQLDSDDDISSIDVFARSGGCFVILMTLNLYKPKKINKIICYGPATYESIEYLFKTTFNETRISNIKKGLFIDENTFSSFRPFEELVSEYDSIYQLIIGFGEDDKYSPWTFADKIKEIVTKKYFKNVFIKKIKGDHVINTENKEYLKMIFE